MKVIHKTFGGGYRFGVFEGQPSAHLTLFEASGIESDQVIQPGKDVTAKTVLDALGLTGFEGPENALVSTKGHIAPDQVTSIIVSTVSVEPYDLPVESFLKQETKARFIDGLKTIHEAYHNTAITLVLSENQEELIQMFAPESDNLDWLTIATMPALYPANFKELIIPTLLEKKYPVGYAPAHIGVLFIKAADVLHVTKVVSENHPADTVIVALAGPGWSENMVLEVPCGLPVKALMDRHLAEGEQRIVKNSIITGETIDEDTLIGYDTSVLIAVPEDRQRQTLFFLRSGKDADSFSNSFLSKLLPRAKKSAGTNLHGERRACVSCTYCQNVCPVGLIPHLLHKHADKGIYNKRLGEYRLFDCIECGLCDYVCPSKIEVSTDIKKAKKEMEKAELGHNKYLMPGCDMLLEPKEVALDE